MSGFFPDEEIKNRAADAPWLKSETDRMLDLYLSNTTPKRIAQILGRNPKAVARRLEQFTYNERDWAVRYEPRRRTSRRGKRFSENDRTIITAHRERGVDPKHTARLLCRDVPEFHSDLESKERHGELKKIGVGVDLVMAYRYAYYVKGISIVTDHAYDELEKEEIEFGVGGDLLKTKVGSDLDTSYPPHVRALAMYLLFKYAGREK